MASNSMQINGFSSKVVDPAKVFSNFIEGNSNRLARSMALAASENPGKSYNPLYIYGGRGTGKTHLLHAICNRAKKNGLSAILCELDEDISAISTMPQIIVMDDLDVDMLYEAKRLCNFVSSGGELVIAGKNPPEKLSPSPLTDMINSMGTSADIQMPEEELRVAILQSKAEADGVMIPGDAALFIARHIPGNVQTLLGGLERVRAMSSLSGQPVTRFSAIQALKEYLWVEEKKEVG